ncbi:MAG: hypothetical protein JWP63_7145 [Candidatus Solibacter sp.]|nr:hypothetical protein [Candidatus Solibacter sp.]
MLIWNSPTATSAVPSTGTFVVPNVAVTGLLKLIADAMMLPAGELPSPVA